MAGADILKEAGGSAIGKLTKAVISIEDNRIREVSVTPLAGGPAFGVANNLTNGIKIVSGERLSGAVASMKQQIAAANPLGTTKSFTVRFNPNELRLSAQGGGLVAKTDFSADGSQMQYEGMKPRIYLTVTLIFDEMERADAFMSDKLSPDGLARTAVGAALKKKRSVRPQVEGFIAAIRNPYTRGVTFSWGTMSYSGQVNAVDSRYTMFAISGEPVRAEVSLGILCVDQTIKNGDMGQWGAYYQKAFGGKDATNLESAAQNVGNLLNFNL